MFLVILWKYSIFMTIYYVDIMITNYACTYCLTKGSCLHKKRTGLCTINSVYNLWTILFLGFIETSSKNCSYNKWALPVIIQLPLKMLFPCEIPFQHCWTNLEAYLSFFVFVGLLGYSILYSFAPIFYILSSFSLSGGSSLFMYCNSFSSGSYSTGCLAILPNTAAYSR